MSDCALNIRDCEFEISDENELTVCVHYDDSMVKVPIVGHGVTDL